MFCYAGKTAADLSSEPEESEDSGKKKGKKVAKKRGRIKKKPKTSSDEEYAQVYSRIT